MTQQVQVGEVRFAIPKTYRPMTEEEKGRYFLGQEVKNAWIDEVANAVVRLDPTSREIPAEGIEPVLLAHLAQYRRLAPGFELGEVLENDEGTMGMITFKSNALTRDLFNIFSAINVDGQEYDMLVSCDMQDAMKAVTFWPDEIAGMLDGEESDAEDKADAQDCADAEPSEVKADEPERVRAEHLAAKAVAQSYADVESPASEVDPYVGTHFEASANRA